MQNLLFAILCSVLVSVLFKVARKSNIMIDQAIAINYLVSIGLSYFLLKPNFDGVGINNFIINSPQTPIFIALGILMPTVFIIMSKAVQIAGIARSDAAQRLSLFLPIIAAFIIFGEQLNIGRITGIILAFMALICLIYKPGQNIESKNSLPVVLSLALVWLGYGLADILFKQVAKMGGAFPNTLFIAFVLSACFMFIYLLIKRTQWTISSILGGLILGGLNFMNIFFYIKAHQSFSQNPTLVFASMNVGVICLGTITGALIFKERMSKVNVAGVVLGIGAILSLFYLPTLLA